MKQITVRYVGDLDFNGKLESIYQTYEKNYKTILFHIYSGVLDRELLLRVTGMIQSRFSTEQIIGSISAGEIKQGRLMDRGILVSAMMFEQSDVRVFRFPESVGKEKEVGRQIRELTDEIEDLKALELMFPGTNLNTRELFEEISKCPPEIQVFGGYAGGHATDSGEHYVFDHKDLYAHMIFLVAYAGKELHVTVDKSVGWQTLGMPFKVTKADGNRLIEVNHRPAVELYQKYMQIEVNEDFAQETFEFPLMAQIDGEEILRHTNSVEADGTLVLAGYVTQGMDIYLCYGAPSDIVNKVDVRLEEMYRFRPEAILLYSCSVRKSFWEDFVNIEMLPFQEIAETAGFHTWGEVNRAKGSGEVLEYNITLMSIGMREGENKAAKKKDGRAKPPRVDDSVLKGQAALIKRLTKLVYATTTELQKAYKDMSVLNEKLVIMAERDGLTGIYNRRKTEQLINECLDETANGSLSGLLMLDIDHFKAVNDTYGHAVGDVTLKDFAKLIGESIAGVKGAVAGRWGGEEFMVLLPGLEEKESMEIAEALRKRIANYTFEEVKHLTASIGVTTGDGTEDRKGIFTRLDDALYEAKEAGRNRVVAAD